MNEPAKRYPARDEIEKADDRPWEDVPAPELGEGAHVRVVTMSANERVSFEAALPEAPPSDSPLLEAAARIGEFQEHEKALSTPRPELDVLMTDLRQLLERLAQERRAPDDRHASVPGILLCRCIQNPETGARMFTNDDAAWLNAKSYRWISRAFAVAMRLNGIGANATAAAVKN